MTTNTDTRAAMQMALEALKMAQSGLQWYRDMHPEDVDGSDDAADEEIEYVKDRLRASLALPAEGAEPRKLWLWKNFVDGKPEYWAFDNPYPCVSVGGDPLTLGGPCGYALLQQSVNGRSNRSEDEVMAAMLRRAATPHPPQDDKEKAAIQAAFTAHEAIQKAIDAYEEAEFGSHVTDPLRGALEDVSYSIKEATS